MWGLSLMSRLQDVETMSLMIVVRVWCMRKHDSCPNSSHCFEQYKVLLSLDACVVRSLILDIQDYLRIRTELGVIMIVSPRVTLAVLVTLSVITDILVSASTFRRQNRRRVHKQRKRPRFGRQEELVKTTSPSSPSPAILPLPHDIVFIIFSAFLKTFLHFSLEINFYSILIQTL